jgi:hypothetical protein
MRKEMLSGDAMPNNSMHPTADTTALIYINLSGRRVMPGVGLLRLKSEIIKC